MNFIEHESDQKLRGAYYTPAPVAALLARWVLAIRPRRLLEPSCGDGAFLQAIAAAPGTPPALLAFELDAAEAAKAHAAWAPRPGEVRAADFLPWAVAEAGGPPSVDGVLGNPPYVRYQYMSAGAQAHAEALLRGQGLPFTRHVNLWVPFLVGALERLAPGGRLGLVIPSELLVVMHAAAARLALLQHSARLLILDPELLLFDGALQGALLLFVEKNAGDAKPADHIRVLRLSGAAFLGEDPEALFAQASPAPAPPKGEKWTTALLSPAERALLTAVEVPRLASLARAGVGIVTGANHFFLVDDETAQSRGLGAYAHPMFGRSDHVPGVIFDEAQLEANRARGLPCRFLYFPAEAALSPAAQSYVNEGEASGLHRRTKCRVRTPWYTVPSVSAAPLALLKRCHDLPRLVRNRLGAYTTDTAYRLWPHDPAQSDALVGGFVNSLTALSAELEGRSYGGGVLELVPSELARLRVPARPEQAARLGPLDRALREKSHIDAILDEQDAAILGPIGLNAAERACVRGAWARLRDRRQRSPAVEGPPSSAPEP